MNENEDAGEPKTKKPKSKDIKVNDIIHTLVKNLTSETEANRLFQSNWKKRTLDGRCVAIQKRAPKSGGRVQQTWIQGYFEWQDKQWTKWIQMRFVEEGYGPAVNVLSIPGYVPPTLPKMPPPAMPVPTPGVATPGVATASNPNQEGNLMWVDGHPPTAATATTMPPADNSNDRLTDHQQWQKEVETVVAAAVAKAVKEPPPVMGVQRPSSSSAGTIPPGNNINVNTKDHGQHIHESHGVKWFSPGEKPIFVEDVPKVQWYMKGKLPDEKYYPGCRHRPLSRLQAWLLMYGDRCFENFYINTNVQLKKRYGDKAGFKGRQEAIKWHGIFRLITRYEFPVRDALWEKVSKFKYVEAANFGEKTKMTRDRFNQIFNCQRYSHQPDDKPADKTSEQHQWMLVDDHVSAFNDHRAENYVPSELICVDESISRWYGTGGYWINAGLPHYVAMDRKPENGCEIQDACDGNTGIMMRLKLVVTKEEEERRRSERNSGVLPEDEQKKNVDVLVELIEPWGNAVVVRIVCGDSFFASVNACDAMKDLNLRFIGPVKTATAGFCNEYLKQLELSGRGQYFAVYTVNKDGRLDKFGFTWMDCNRMQFVSNTSSTYLGNPFLRKRLRQIDQTPDAPPQRVEFDINQPEASALYYTCNGKIDRHNRRRQQVLKIENKINVKDWDLRVNHSIMAINDVDTYNFRKAMGWSQESPYDFYCHLIDEMIDNVETDLTYQLRPSRSPTNVSRGSPPSAPPIPQASPTVPKLVETTKRRIIKGKLHPNKKVFTNCKICKNRKTPWVCSICKIHICEEHFTPNCWPDHLRECHNN